MERPIPLAYGPGIALTVPRAPEPAAAPSGCREILDHLECHLHHRHDHHLRDPIAGIDGERLSTAIPGRDHQGALVVGIDQADQVAEHNAVLMTEARPG